MKRNPAISYFRLQNDFFNRILCEEKCLDEPRIEERDLEEIILVPYMFMNTTAGTPSVLGATRGNRNFDIRYQALDGGNITGKLIRAAYKVNITTESDVIIRQSVKPTRTSRFRSASTTATLKAMIDNSIFDDRDRSSSKAKESDKGFLDGSAVVVSKEAEKKKRTKKPQRPRRPTSLF